MTPGSESSQHRAKHQKSVHSGIHFVSLRILCSPAAFRCQANPGKWTLRSRAAARGDCLRRPPSQNRAWTRGTLSLRLSRSSPTSARRRPHVGGRSPQGPAFANAAGCAALRNRTDGATAAAVGSKHKVAGAPRNKQLSTSHHFLAITSPRHTMHPTILIF